MKCTGKKLILAGSLSAFLLGLTGCGADDAVLTYEKENYNKSLYEAELFAEDLCVAGGDVSLEGFEGELPNMSDQALAENYPGLSQSVAQVFHTTDERLGRLGKQ